VSKRIRDFYPVRAFYRPGEPLEFRAEIEASSAGRVRARLNIIKPGGPTQRTSHDVALRPALNQVDLAASIPTAAGDAFIVELALDDRTAPLNAVTSTDVLRSWKDDPRYGFLSEFGLNDGAISSRVAKTARLHLTCLQFYDWMYRHYRLLPPREEFRDALGRTLSLKTIRMAIDACHAHGIAALAYAAVYAAEPEFFLKHPSWGLYKGNGSSHMLGKLFHLMDLGRNSPWVRFLLKDFDRTLRRVPFDGFHLDQYGFPRVGYTETGVPRDVAQNFAEFIDRVSSGTRGRDGGSIFNAVNAWPLEKVAPTKQVAIYIEVWPPHVSYADLVGLVRRTHDLAPGKPVILAAYPSFLRDGKPHSPQAIADSLTLMTAVIMGSGAWHLLLGEGDAALAHPYYPNHVHLPPDALRQLRRYYDFAVAYRAFLRDPALREVAATFIDGGEPPFNASLPYASTPAVGRVWAGMRTKPGWLVISLVNLLGEEDLLWDGPRNPRTAREIRLELPDDLRFRRCLVASPDGAGSFAPTPQSLGDGQRPTIEISLSTWSLVLLETDH